MVPNRRSRCMTAESRTLAVEGQEAALKLFDAGDEDDRF